MKIFPITKRQQCQKRQWTCLSVIPVVSGVLHKTLFPIAADENLDREEVRKLLVRL
jgi:hypothetical protein